MPESRGSAILSSASAPKRRRTKSARVSSSSSFRAGRHQVHPHAQFAQGRDQGREGEGHEAGGHDEQDTVGQGHRPAAVQDKDPAHLVVGAEQAVAQAKLPGQLRGPRLLSQERIGAALDDELLAAGALGGLGDHVAAGPGRRFEDRAAHRQAGRARRGLQVPGRAEAGDAAADHGHVEAARLGCLVAWYGSSGGPAGTGREWCAACPAG